MNATATVDGASYAVALRLPEAIRESLYEAECEVTFAAAEVQSMRDRIASDEFDGGRIGRGAMAAAKLGNRTNAYELGQAYGQLSRLRDAHRGALAARSALRAELATWSARVPVGMVEIAAMLGYGADAPRQWKRRNVLPAPAGTVSGTPYWWRADVLRWAIERGRTRAILTDDPRAYDADRDDEQEAMA